MTICDTEDDTYTGRKCNKNLEHTRRNFFYVTKVLAVFIKGGLVKCVLTISRFMGSCRYDDTSNEVTHLKSDI